MPIRQSQVIFRIKANREFITRQEGLLSFRKSQEFFVIGTAGPDASTYYYVSTNKSLPFARGAVTGLVPIDHFTSRSGLTLQQRRNQYQQQQYQASVQSAPRIPCAVSLSMPPARKQRYCIRMAGMLPEGEDEEPSFKLVIHARPAPCRGRGDDGSSYEPTSTTRFAQECLSSFMMDSSSGSGALRSDVSSSAAIRKQIGLPVLPGKSSNGVLATFKSGWSMATAGKQKKDRAPGLSIVTNGQQSIVTNGQQSIASTGRQSIASTGQQSIVTTGQQSIMTTGRQSIMTTGRQSIMTTGRQSIITTGRQSFATFGEEAQLPEGWNGRRRSSGGGTIDYIYATVQELHKMDKALREAQVTREAIRDLPRAVPSARGKIEDRVSDWEDYFDELSRFIARHVRERQGVFSSMKPDGRKRADSGFSLTAGEFVLS
ncbi:MAG: hypothetical protein SGCHY_002164 [Lobulomycetales sp.]